MNFDKTYFAIFISLKLLMIFLLNILLKPLRAVFNKLTLIPDIVIYVYVFSPIPSLPFSFFPFTFSFSLFSVSLLFNQVS